LILPETVFLFPITTQKALLLPLHLLGQALRLHLYMSSAVTIPLNRRLR
jgi:hypothetical protein